MEVDELTGQCVLVRRTFSRGDSGTSNLVEGKAGLKGQAGSCPDMRGNG